MCLSLWLYFQPAVSSESQSSAAAGSLSGAAQGSRVCSRHCYRSWPCLPVGQTCPCLHCRTGSATLSAALLCWARRAAACSTPGCPPQALRPPAGCPRGTRGAAEPTLFAEAAACPAAQIFFLFFHQSLGCPGWAESQGTGAEVCQQQEVSSAPGAAGATGGVGAVLDKARGSELTGQQQGSATSGLLRKFLESST